MQIPALIALLGLAVSAQAVTVSTAQYGNARTSANTAETVITPSNVSGLHKRCSLAVDGHVYAQVLIIDDVNISGATKVGVSVTMNNSVYLFNADTCAQIWTVNLGATYTDYPTTTAFPGNQVGCLSTPVIDTGTSVLYASCVRSSGQWRLYSFNLADGSTFHAPVTFAGSNNSVTFAPASHLQRSALLLLNGTVYACFASYGDDPPYQGWCFGVNATSLAITAIWCDTSTSNGQGGIWMGGGGPASDGTDIYLSTGNGDFAANNYSNSFVRLSQLLAPLDYATPANWSSVINPNDRDINSGKVFVTGNYVVGGGKDGRIFVLDKSGSSTMGGLEGVGAGPHQLFAAQNGAIFACTVFANNSLILGALNTTLKRFSWDSGAGTFNTSPVAVGAGPFSNPGPSCSYTSNGSDTSTALLWGVTPAASAFSSVQVGTLRAWDAASMTEIWNSGSGSDALGNFAKFAAPTIANGMVYVPTFSNSVVAYGFPLGVSLSISGKATISGKFSIQ